MKRRHDWGAVVTVVCVTFAACAPPAEEPPSPSGETNAEALNEPPWDAPALSRVPDVYRTAWERAENREECALLAFGSPEYGDEASTRSAYFGGGWGVAYDLQELRSAFGVAGTGSAASSPDVYSAWPHWTRWADGSAAGYGPEGGTGPNYLAYLTIPGQDCLYNVWSAFGREHLEQLLGELRWVQTLENPAEGGNP